MQRWVCLGVLILAACGRRASAADCAPVPGDWTWSIGAVVTFKTDHSVLVNGTPLGRWECTNPRQDVATVFWSNGFVDTMTFTGEKASAKNQLGIQTTGTKASGSRASAAPPPAARAPVAAGGAVDVVTASGALRECLGIAPGAAKMTPLPDTAASCRQLPAMDLFDQAGARFKANDHVGAARILMNAAQAGNPKAQLRLAIMYEAGDGVPRDTKMAFSRYARAAASGEPGSQSELGGYYEEADGVPENWDLAARLYRASASQGWQKGQFALGRAYQFGIGVPQDRSQAIAWFQRSAAQGNSQGAYYARWLSDRSNNIGFRNDAEHNQVIAGKLRFALGAADPAGITFHNSGERVAWLKGLGQQLNATEAQTMWQIRKDEYDSCMRNGGRDCHDPGRRP